LKQRFFLRSQIDDLSKIKGVLIESTMLSVDNHREETGEWITQTRRDCKTTVCPTSRQLALIEAKSPNRQFEPERFKDLRSEVFGEVKVERKQRNCRDVGKLWSAVSRVLGFHFSGSLPMMSTEASWLSIKTPLILERSSIWLRKKSAASIALWL